MKIRLILLIASLFISTGSILVGYISAGFWLILPAIPVLVSLWAFARKESHFRAGSIMLLGFVILAAVGVISGLSVPAMLVACTAALISWDLYLFDRRMAGSPPHPSIADIEGRHIQSLIMGAIAGLLLGVLAINIRLQLPFIAIAFFVLIALGGLLASMRSMGQAK
jgi:hypothetical protein